MSIEDEDAYAEEFEKDQPFEPNMIFVVPRQALDGMSRTRLREAASLVVEQIDPYEFHVLKTRFCDDPHEPVGFGTVAEMIERTTIDW